MAKAEFEALPPEEIIRRIEIALEHGGGTHTWDDIRQQILDGRAQIFWNDDGVVITEIVDNPQFRTLHCMVIAGRMQSIPDLQEQIIRHGISSGCKYMTMSGRSGWERVLPKHGWQKFQTVMKYDLAGMI
jgi:hypothetical protein